MACQHSHFAKQIYRSNNRNFLAIPSKATLTVASCSVRSFSNVCQRIPFGFQPL